MKKHISILCLVLSLGGLSCSAKEGNDLPEPPSDTLSIEVPFGDPFIMLYEDVYYAYGTNAADGIEVYTSDDLLTWKVSERRLALDKKEIGRASCRESGTVGALG